MTRSFPTLDEAQTHGMATRRIRYQSPPLISFDYPEAHIRHPFDADPIDFSFDDHCAGASQRATAVMLRDWMRSEHGVPDQFAHAVREFFHQLSGLELIEVHRGGGASTYEFARTLIGLEVWARRPILYLCRFSTHGLRYWPEDDDPFSHKHAHF